MRNHRVHYVVSGSFSVDDHVWFGSLKPHTSPNDPVFFLHHCFVDKVWADWLAHHGRQYLPAEAIPKTEDTLVEVPGPNTPLRPFDRAFANISTPASVLDHHNLGYRYDTQPEPS